MTLDELFARGVTSTTGQLDFKGQNVGYLTAKGPVLNDDADEILNAAPPAAPVDLEPAPVARQPKASKVAKTRAPAAPVEAETSLGDLLGAEDA